MQKMAVTVLGADRPGIVCKVAQLLADRKCNIEDVSQTVLQDEFSGIFIISMPENLSMSQLDDSLAQGLQGTDLFHFLKPVQDRVVRAAPESEPFVVIAIGPDRVGLIATVTCVMKDFGVNITNLQFVSGSQAFPGQAVTIYEVDVPTQVKLSEFVTHLTERAAEVGLETNVQHKKIFEDICRL